MTTHDETRLDVDHDETVQLIDDTLAAGEQLPDDLVDMDFLVDDFGTVLSAAGAVLHLLDHEFVDRKQVRQHASMMLRSMGSILFQLGGAES
jgi:hypothetical protein